MPDLVPERPPLVSIAPPHLHRNVAKYVDSECGKVTGVGGWAALQCFAYLLQSRMTVLGVSSNDALGIQGLGQVSMQWVIATSPKSDSRAPVALLPGFDPRLLTRPTRSRDTRSRLK